MPDCECLPRCPFFNDRMADMPALADTMKGKYCRGEFGRCARHQIFEKLGSEGVPLDLFPNQLDRVASILGG